MGKNRAWVITTRHKLVRDLFRRFERKGVTLAELVERSGYGRQQLLHARNGRCEVRFSLVADLADLAGYNLVLVPKVPK